MYKLLYQMSAWNIACTEMRPCKMRMPTGPALENYLFDNHSALWVILNQEGAQVHKLLALFVSPQHISWFQFLTYDKVGSFDDFSHSKQVFQHSKDVFPIFFAPFWIKTSFALLKHRLYVDCIQNE